MEDFGDIEETNDIAVFIAYRLKGKEWEKGERRGRRGRIGRTKCRKCLSTMSCKASVALVVSRVTMGFLVIIWLTWVV